MYDLFTVTCERKGMCVLSASSVLTLPLPDTLCVTSFNPHSQCVPLRWGAGVCVCVSEAEIERIMCPK